MLKIGKSCTELGKFEITIISCASENAILLFASLIYLFLCMIFYKPWIFFEWWMVKIWMVEFSCELFLNGIIREKVASSSFIKVTLPLLTHESSYLKLPSFYMLLYTYFQIFRNVPTSDVHNSGLEKWICCFNHLCILWCTYFWYWKMYLLPDFESVPISGVPNSELQ